MPSTDVTAEGASPSAGSSTESIPIYEKEAFFSNKYRNFCIFVESIARYLSEAEPWAEGLRSLPLSVFKLQARVYFAEAIQAHLRGDSQGRDCAAAAVIRRQAEAQGLLVGRIKSEDNSKLLRYACLFSILLSE